MGRETQGPALLDPLFLIVPGLGNSGPGHWQSLWEQRRGDCRRVELGMWERPHRNTWVNQLNLAIGEAGAGGRPVILVAHSLGCLAVAWWAALERPAPGGPVKAALLVAPPEVDEAPLDQRIAAFAPTPRSALPFPSLLVGSRNDPYMTLDQARALAADWGSTFVDAGSCGHINADSGIDAWPMGETLLVRLVEGPAPDFSWAAGLPAAAPLPAAAQRPSGRPRSGH